MKDIIDQKFVDAGFVLEDFLGVWMKHDDDIEVTIADGVSCNGESYEVQVTHRGGEFLTASEGHQTPDSAIAFAATTIACAKEPK